MKKLNLNFLLGVFLVFIGGLTILDKFDILSGINYSVILFSFMILVGLVTIVSEKKLSIFPIIIIFIGSWNVLREYKVLSGNILAIFWPTILILVGLNLIFSRKKYLGNNNPKLDLKESQVYNGILSGIEEKIISKDFKGLVANACLGGVEIDLREVEIKEDVLIQTFAFLGGVSILLPERYNVVVNDSMSMLGGVENKYKGINDTKRKTIYITNRAILGGVELK